MEQNEKEIYEAVASNIFKQSTQLPQGVSTPVQGYDFNQGVDYVKLLESLASTGFQATHFAKAIDVVNAMIKRRASEPASEKEAEKRQLFSELNESGRPVKGLTLFLGFTSNMVSCGVRETIRYLAQHNMIDALVTTAGGVEEDFVKCFAPFYIGQFDKWSGGELRKHSINRTGNLLVPNTNYCLFERWLLPILDQLLAEQQTENKIPVFCPGLTDGSLGDILFTHSFKSPGLRVDLVEDIRRINLVSLRSVASGMLVLGGGLAKHHTYNACLMRNGADYCVQINTAQEFDGSDSGARPDEAVSWGKIGLEGQTAKVHADASFLFPLLVAQTFAKSTGTFSQTKQMPNCDMH